MDINFPLILVVLVFGTGIIWLLDILFLAKPRRAAVGAVETEFAGVKEGDGRYAGFQQAIAVAQREPVLVEYSKSFFPVLLLVLVLRSFLFEPFQIPSESMVPTLEVGDFILVNKHTYGIRLPVIRTKVLDIKQPKRGDVMVFFPPHKKQYFIKRVIGLPGDKIEIKNTVLYVNGQEQSQEAVGQVWGRHSRGSSLYNVKNESLGDNTHAVRFLAQPVPRPNVSLVVPDGEYFMMGDNRDNSGDSRSWGTVPEGNIVGKAVVVWMHWEGWSWPSFSDVRAIN